MSRLTRFVVIACHLVVLSASLTRAAAPQSKTDAHAAEVIQHAVHAAAGLKHYRADMQQVDVMQISDKSAPFAGQEVEVYATFSRTPQVDGTTILHDRVDGHYEFVAGKGEWNILQRVGGD